MQSLGLKTMRWRVKSFYMGIIALLLASCNAADLRPQADIDQNSVTRSLVADIAMPATEQPLAEPEWDSNNNSGPTSIDFFADDNAAQTITPTLAVEPSQSNLAVEPSQSNLAVEPSQSTLAVEPSQSNLAVEPSQSNLVGELRAPIAVITPSAPIAIVAPKTPVAIVAPKASTSARILGKLAPSRSAPKQEDKRSLLGTVTAGLFPRLSKPNTGLPEIEAKCRTALKRAGVAFTSIPSIGNGGSGSCGIRYPVKVTSFAGNIELKPAATLNCQMALKFSEWVKKDLQPAARLRFASGIQSVGQMSAYSCRKIAGSKRLSEHSFGNAIDIGSFTLNNGKKITVRSQEFFAFRNKSLLKKVRSDACKRFTTVLGPGYNKAHADHFHFDLMSRRRTSCN